MRSIFGFLALALLGTIVAGCVGARTDVGFTTNQGPREEVSAARY